MQNIDNQMYNGAIWCYIAGLLKTDPALRDMFTRPLWPLPVPIALSAKSRLFVLVGQDDRYGLRVDRRDDAVRRVGEDTVS